MLGVYTAAALARLAGPAPSRLEQILWLLAPMTAALGLGFVLLVGSRRVERAHATFNESERRFRLAVEAARCGIWEWDLATDTTFRLGLH